MEVFHPEFYRMVRGARVLLGWTQSELARKAEISLSTLNRLERGEGFPSVKSLGRLNQIFLEAGVRFVVHSPTEYGVMVKMSEGKK